MFQSLDMKPMLENINFSYIAQNHLSITILIHFVYRCQLNITTEFKLADLTKCRDNSVYK